jgi:hypothetical protein
VIAAVKRMQKKYIFHESRCLKAQERRVGDVNAYLRFMDTTIANVATMTNPSTIENPGNGSGADL